MKTRFYYHVLSADPRKFLTPHNQEAKQKLALGKWMDLEVKNKISRTHNITTDDINSAVHQITF